MISLARLASWRLRLRRLCGLSLSTSSRGPRTNSTFEDDRQQQHHQLSKQESSVRDEEEPDSNIMDTQSSGTDDPMDQEQAMRDFVDRVEQMGSNGFSDANMDFAKLRSAQDALQMQVEYSISDGYGAIQNRYRDVVPYNKNRVRLENNESGDYINASLIEYPRVPRKYIGTQAPLTATIDDFWHMIGQFKIKVVVMLCNVVESSVVKCVQYFPLKVGEDMQLTHGSVQTIKEEQFDDFCVREFRLKTEKFGETIIHQLHYKEWPDHGAPKGLQPVHQFVEMMDDFQCKHGEDAPILLHCSAGCGRTGTVIGVDIFRSLIRNGNIDRKIVLRDFVLELRKQRTALVQSASQFQLLHKLIAHYCSEALNRQNGHSNTTEEEEPAYASLCVASDSESVDSSLHGPSGLNYSSDSDAGDGDKKQEHEEDLVKVRL